jgi:hypothetical protein
MPAAVIVADLLSRKAIVGVNVFEGMKRLRGLSPERVIVVTLGRVQAGYDSK